MQQPTPNTESQPTILIIDDHRDVHYVLEGLLEDEGYNLAFADNGRDGIKLAMELVPDLIISDAMMPEMDGFEVCEWLRSTKILAEVPIIMMTALDDDESKVRAIQAGVDDFLTKPFSMTEMKARVHNIIRLNRYRLLLAERTKFDWAVQQADDGYLTINQDGVITYANGTAKTYLNLPDNLEEAAPFMTTVLQTYQCQPDESWANWPQPTLADMPRYLIRPETSEDNAFWLRVNSLRMSAARSGSIWVIHLRDVTQMMTFERNMRGFHIMASHKLRTPLTAVLGSLESINDFGDSMSPDEMAEMLSIANKGAHQLRTEVEDVLRYIDPFDEPAPEQWIRLGQIPALVDHLNHELDLEADCQLKLTHKVILPLSPQTAELIFREVLENAKKFHPTNSPSITVHITPGETWNINLRIIDDGRHLSPQQLSNIWAPYYQVDKYGTGEVKGMGLGLSTVAMIVWSIGGSYRIYNRPDAPGMVVHLKLPVHQPQ